MAINNKYIAYWRALLLCLLLPIKTTHSQIYFLPWKQLNTPQREAVLCLGYTNETWDCNLFSNEVTHWWIDLPYEKKICAFDIGHDERSWNLLPTPVYKYFWIDLSQKEQEAAICIGYDTSSWDKGLVTVIFSTNWNNLSKEVKICALSLGFKECSWNLYAKIQRISQPQLPKWVEDQNTSWGEILLVPEWNENEKGASYRDTHGWSGSDLVHDINAPIRVMDYFVTYGPGMEDAFSSGGVGTQLTGVAHFTNRAESHAGFCHGGSMCSLLDDVIGWVSFLVTGTCIPWSGFTVQINSSLKKPIPVDSILKVQAVIRKVERRKISVFATISDPLRDDVIHASGEGLVVLNVGVLPES